MNLELLPYVFRKEVNGNEEKDPMAEPSPPTLLVLLTDETSGGRVAVSLDGFMAYADRLIRDLEKLEARWIATAAPSARASEAPRRRIST